MTRYFLTLITFFISICASAQGESAATSNNFMLSNHKVFVSVAVLTLILLIIFVFLFWIERRLKQLEDRQKS